MMKSFNVKAPGRVNLIGEHTDYNAGKVLPFAIDRHITLEVEILDQNMVELSEVSLEFVTSLKGESKFMWTGAQIKELLELDQKVYDFRPFLKENEGSWKAYVIGCVHMHFLKPSLLFTKAVRIAITSNLPQGAGISSSAALCTGLLTALSHLQKTTADKLALAHDAMQVEHRFAGTQCGLMDQIAVIMSKSYQFTEIDFAPYARGQSPRISYIKAHEVFSQYQLVTINTMVKHKLSDSPYNERRDSCKRVLEKLNEIFGTGFRGLGEFSYAQTFWDKLSGFTTQENLASTLVKRFHIDAIDANKASHAIVENLRVDMAAAAIEKGDLESLTKAMNESHLSLSRDYQVSCFELDCLRQAVLGTCSDMQLKLNLSEPICLGARMTGGGFGGSTVQYIHHKATERLQEIFSAPNNPYTRQTDLIPEIMITPPCDGIEIFETT